MQVKIKGIIFYDRSSVLYLLIRKWSEIWLFIWVQLFRYVCTEIRMKKSVSEGQQLSGNRHFPRNSLEVVSLKIRKYKYHECSVRDKTKIKSRKNSNWPAVWIIIHRWSRISRTIFCFLSVLKLIMDVFWRYLDF